MAWAGALLAVALTACGPLPRPFRDAGAPPGLLDLGDGPGIRVHALVGDGPGVAGAGAEVMAEALRNLGVPAATQGGNRASRGLYGLATLTRAGDEERLRLLWELRAPDGTVIGLHHSEISLPHGLWQAGDAAAIAPHIAAGAPAIAAMVQVEAVEEVAIPGFPGARLMVLPLDDVPGDGAVSLRRSLQEELRAADLPVAAEVREGDILIFGKVVLTAPRDGQQLLSISWTATRTGGEAELGQVDQQNSIPAGSLDGPWGPVAREIAKAAAAGLIDLLDQAGRGQIRSTATG
jgi:hypothetical protein